MRQQLTDFITNPEEKITSLVNSDSHILNLDISSINDSQHKLDDYVNFLRTPSGKKMRGLLYEQYVGYIWEKEGYNVEYRGIDRYNQGKGDEGIDLICCYGGYTWIVQCKNYFRKTIKPKDILELRGTIELYKNEHDGIVRGAFFTTSSFSDISKQIANALNIELFEPRGLSNPTFFPMIKCLMCEDEQIYILPHDDGNKNYMETKLVLRRVRLY